MVICQFSELEALKIAVRIEKKGAQFYKMAQGVCKDAQLKALLEMLRVQEDDHAAAFEAMVDSLPLAQTVFDDETNAFLSAVATGVVFPGGVMASMLNARLETVEDILMQAIGSEKDSILFYYELLERASSGETAAVLRRIIKEEKVHLFDLQTLLEETKR